MNEFITKRMEKFKRTERIVLLAIFLLTVPIVVLTFINYHPDIYLGTPDKNWVWHNIVRHIIPNGFNPGIILPFYYPRYQPGIPFLAVMGITFIVFLPMFLIKRTRYAGAVGLMIASYVFAAFLWLYSLAIVWGAEGGRGVTIIGLCLGWSALFLSRFFCPLCLRFMALLNRLS